jgi:hypothetical protein
MAYNISNIARLNFKELQLTVVDGVSLPTEIIFLDSGATADWGVVSSPSDLPNAVQYFSKLNLLLSNVNSYVIRDIPYRVGSHTLFIKHEGVWYKQLNVELTSEPLTSPFPSTLNRATTKQKASIVNNNDVKGGIKIFTDIYDLLLLDKEEMELGMKCTIWLADENKIKTYALNPNYAIADIPYPLKDEPYDINEPRATDLVSFRKYWYLDSVAEPELQPVARIQYAPEYEGGIPPFFEGYISANVKSDGYTFPAASVWDEERTFTSTKWTNNLISLGENKSVWKRIKRTVNGNWSRPIRVDQLASGYRANRFSRRFQFPKELGNLGTEVDFRIRTFFEGEPNLLAEYSITDTSYSFEDIPPLKKNWEEIVGEEQSAYITYYNAAYSGEIGYEALTDIIDIDTLADLTIGGKIVTARSLIEKDNNTLWVVYAQKDDFTNLESPWTDIQLFIEDNPALVRFNSKETSGAESINNIRIAIDAKVTDLGGEESDYYADYDAVGWVKDFDYDLHSYVSTRESEASPWVTQKLRGESGVYEDIKYKEYPINYYDRLNNTRTKFNYIPVGLNGTKNPQDEISGDPVDTAFQPKEGFELYFSTAKKAFNNVGALSDWTPWIRSSARPAVLDRIIAVDNIFRSVSNEGANETFVTRENTSLFLEASLLLQGNEIQEGDVYQEANVAEGILEQKEEIRYTWKRLYNNGEAENLVIVDQSPNRLYYGYKAQVDYQDYLDNGNGLPVLTPLTENGTHKLNYELDNLLGFKVTLKSNDSNTGLERVIVTSGAEGYKRNGNLYDAADLEIVSTLWVTDDISKLADPAWADYAVFEFEGSYNYTTKLITFGSSKRVVYLTTVTYTENAVESTVAPFTLTNEGKTLEIHHIAVEGKAVFEVTQWRKTVGNIDFVGVDEDFIPYKSEQVVIDLVDRVKRDISILPDSNFLLAKPNFTTYTEAEFIGKKSITISRYLENLAVGAWYVFDHVNYNFEDAQKGINAFNAIAFIDVLKDNTYWTALGATGLSYNVTFADFIAGDNTLINFKTYKYQVVENTITYLDYVTLGINFSGQAARDIRITPEAFVLPLNIAGDAFDGTSSITFRTVSENVTNPFYEWKLLNNAGATVKTLVGNATSYPANIANEFTLDFATDTDFGADLAARLAYIKANTPFRVTVKDLVVNLNTFVEEATLTYVQGGVGGLKGESGIGGLNVIFDKNDLVPSESNGTTGAISESTSILVYRGVDAQTIGSASGEFNIQLVDARDVNGTLIETAAANAINGNGVVATVPTEGTITVTAIPANLDAVVIRFKVREGTTILQDGSATDVIFNYKLTKAKAGKPYWNIFLDNELQSLQLNSSSNPVVPTVGLAGTSYYLLGQSIFTIIEGATNKNTEVISGIKATANLAVAGLAVSYGGNNYLLYKITSAYAIAVGVTFNNILFLSTFGQAVTTKFGITLNAATNGETNPRIDKIVNFAKIEKGVTPNQYYLSSNVSLITESTSSPTITVKEVVNNATESINSVTYKINNTAFNGTLGTVNIIGGVYSILVNKSKFKTVPFITVEATIVVNSFGGTKTIVEYISIANKISQNFMTPVYAGVLASTDSPANRTYLANRLKENYGVENEFGYIAFDDNYSLFNQTRGNAFFIPFGGSAYFQAGCVIAFEDGLVYVGADQTLGVVLEPETLGELYDDRIFFSFEPIDPNDGTVLYQAWMFQGIDGKLEIGDFIQVGGEAGERGRTYIPKDVYIAVNEGTIPSSPTNETIFANASLTGNETSPSGNWTTAIPLQADKIVWKSSMLLEKDAPDSTHSYRYTASAWTTPLRLTGIGGAYIVRAYGSSASLLSSTRVASATPAGWNTRASAITTQTVYVIEKYVTTDGTSIKRFNLAGTYVNVGDHTWSIPSIFKKDGTNGLAGLAGRGINDLIIDQVGDLQVQYTQTPFNSSYENLGRVVGTNGTNGTNGVDGIVAYDNVEDVDRVFTSGGFEIRIQASFQRFLDTVIFTAKITFVNAVAFNNNTIASLDLVLPTNYLPPYGTTTGVLPVGSIRHFDSYFDFTDGKKLKIVGNTNGITLNAGAVVHLHGAWKGVEVIQLGG